MKSLTLGEINNAILGTDIKIVDSTNITDFNSGLNSLNCYGVYVLNYKHKESYIGMAYRNSLKSRLSTYLRETHQRKLIESIDVFITSSYHAQLLEKIMIKTFKPELNSDIFEQVNYDDFDNIETIDKKIEILEKELELLLRHDKSIINVSDQFVNNSNGKIKAIPLPIEYWNNQIQIYYLKKKKELICHFGY